MEQTDSIMKFLEQNCVSQLMDGETQLVNTSLILGDLYRSIYEMRNPSEDGPVRCV